MVYLETVFEEFGIACDHTRYFGIIPLLATKTGPMVLDGSIHLALRQSDKVTRAEVDEMIVDSGCLLIDVVEPWPQPSTSNVVPPLLQRLSSRANLDFVLSFPTHEQPSDLSWLQGLSNLKRVVVTVQQASMPPLRSGLFILQGLVGSIYARVSNGVEVTWDEIGGPPSDSGLVNVSRSDLETVANTMKPMHGSLVRAIEMAPAGVEHDRQ